MTDIQQIITQELWARLDEVMRPDGSMHQLDIGPTTLGDWLGDRVYAALIDSEARPAHWGSVADLQAAYSEIAAKLDEAETAMLTAQAERDRLRAERDYHRADADQLATVRDAMRTAAHIADPEDLTDWQRGYRACSRKVLAAAESIRESRVTTPTHRYRSTACYHGHHADCATGGTRWDGTSKTPAQCKWCDAKCECRECDHNPLVMDGNQPDRG